ncbi:hypothetical protein [Citrobacter freundii]|uniref:Uncharacterized protein n=1 Tax=Citrobacter freundii TaxID=546 RepID=A0A7G2IHM8_CITFR|nr:hypothetical protein [Citrobacter freundii]
MRGTMFLMNHHWYLCDCQGYVTGITKKKPGGKCAKPGFDMDKTVIAIVLLAGVEG